MQARTLIKQDNQKYYWNVVNYLFCCILKVPSVIEWSQIKLQPEIPGGCDLNKFNVNTESVKSTLASRFPEKLLFLDSRQGSIPYWVRACFLLDSTETHNNRPIGLGFAWFSPTHNYVHSTESLTASTVILFGGNAFWTHRNKSALSWRSFSPLVLLGTKYFIKITRNRAILACARKVQ